MDPRLYDVLFSGELVAGTAPAEVKRRLAALFKSDAAAIERLFSGQTVVIKKGVDESTAARYREALRQAGAVCEVRAVASAPAAEQPPVREVSSSQPAVSGGQGGQTHESAREAEPAPAESLASAAILPAGTLLPQPPAIEPPRYDLHGLSLAEAGVDLTTPEPAPARALPDISGISLAPVGSDLAD